ncbi:glycosyltransferase family 2 protein [Pedobacter rhizosphaerae]|uniref:Glycosyl transferase family 2 n=1 Tax=Pedobacter rhizosphaerae TaxID=390241 RepID=A0A1H9N6W8_9SPHI|nr:glycosyltransferase family 2 protein [Pedobacter rhizosphaerae]SER31561.1 Glycosyl transferase family 2 [Pedobacter rhizosphaerae]
MSSIALCIPAFNAAWCLPRLLESANNQSIPFNEILVYDDCSTDNTREVAVKYGAKVITGRVNKGCAFGKNQLAAVAQSDWLHFHDADDELLPNFTQVAHKWINSESAPDIILLNYNYIDFNSNEPIGSANFNRNDLLDDTSKFVIVNKIVNFAICKKLSFLSIGGFNQNTEVLYNEDRAFYTRALLHQLRFDYEPIITCINYRYAQSMSASNMLKCAQAYYHVSVELANALGHRYPTEIAECFWKNAQLSAQYKDWTLTRKNIIGARKLQSKAPASGNKFFNLICTFFPMFAHQLREFNIRLLKPQLRSEQ